VDRGQVDTPESKTPREKELRNSPSMKGQERPRIRELRPARVLEGRKKKVKSRFVVMTGQVKTMGSAGGNKLRMKRQQVALDTQEGVRVRKDQKEKKGV